MDKKNPENSEEKYYKQIVNLAKVAIVKFDKELIITDFTGNSEIIFGFKKKEHAFFHSSFSILKNRLKPFTISLHKDLNISFVG